MLEPVALFATFVLAFVFFISSVFKLADYSGTKRAVQEFGTPIRYSGAFARLLPAVELLTALLLVTAGTRTLGAFAALTLLFAFTIAISYNLSRGVSTECRCFGHLRAQPIGWHTFGRNAGLLMIALVLVVFQSAGTKSLAVGWRPMLLTGISLAGLVAVILFEFVVSPAAQRSLTIRPVHSSVPATMASRMQRATREEIPASEANATHTWAGALAPGFRLPSTAGGEITLSDLTGAGHRAVLVFIDPDCDVCESILAEVAEVQRAALPEIVIEVIGCGTRDEHVEKAERYGIPRMLIQDDWEVADAYGAETVPSAVLVRPGGTVGSPIADGPDEVLRLLHRVTRASVSVESSMDSFETRSHTH